MSKVTCFVLGALVLSPLSSPVARGAAPAVEILNSVAAVSPRVATTFREPAAFVETGDGRFLVFDRRAQAVFSLDANLATPKKLTAVGPSDGELLSPFAFALTGQRSFIVLDVPGAYERVQTFHDTGTPLTAFSKWPERGAAPRLTVGGTVFNGFSPVTASRAGLLTQAPGSAALFSELDVSGRVLRQVGQWRATGFERDALLHRALNAGVALEAPDGSLWFVFTGGLPLLRKYTAAGDFVFERHIEGPELDPVVQALPTVWPTRIIGSREIPVVAPTVRAAAFAPDGRLWVSLVTPFTYIYDEAGNKSGTVQFRGANPIAADHIAFGKDGRILVAPELYVFTRPR